MKRWAWLTIALYVAFLSAFTVPVLLFLSKADAAANVLLVFSIFLAPVLILAQAVLLLVPLASVQERPVKRRRIVVSAVIGAIPMALMTVGLFGSIALLVFGEGASGDYLYGWPTVSVFGAFWLVWGIMFWKTSVSRDPASFTSTITRWLLKGSILELVVAVPSHIISRRRGECCAPTLTLMGIVTGLAVAMMSFGPGLFFLFARRIKDKRRAAT